MGSTGHKGIDVRQTANRLLVRVLLQDSNGAIVTGGTTSLRLYELQDDATLKSYDFNDNTFKSTALTTETASMTHRTGNNGGTNTGIWTYLLSTLSGFTNGAIYLTHITNSGAFPVVQVREWQFGSEQGDLVVDAGNLEVDVHAWKDGAVPTPNQTGVPLIDLKYILGTVLTETAGQIAAAFKKFFDKATPTGTINSIPDAVAGAAGGIAIVGSNMGSATSVSGSVGSVAGNVTGSVGSLAAQAQTDVQSALTTQGYTTTRAGYLDTLNGLAQAIWDKATSALVTVGSIGKLLVDNVNATITSRLATGSYTTPPTANAIADQVWDEATADHQAAGSTGLALTSSSAPSAATVADAVWDEALTEHLGAGSTGVALNGASAPSAAVVADAVWDEAIAGHLTAGSTGKKLNDVSGAGTTLEMNADITEIHVSSD